MHNRVETAGFAQLVVLSGLALLSGLVFALYESSFNELKLQTGLKRLYEDRVTATSAARRVFAAIEDDGDPFELPLTADRTLPVSMTTGHQMIHISLEHEAGKISAWTIEPLVLDRYLSFVVTPGSARPQLATDNRQNRPIELRNAISVAFMDMQSPSDFERDFSSFHASKVTSQWASDHVLSAIGGRLADQNPGEVAQALFSIVLDIGLSQGKRYTFLVTSGGRTVVLGTSD